MKLDKDINFVDDDGVIQGKAYKGEKLIIRSPLQQRNDKYYSPPIKLRGGSFVKVMYTEKKVMEMLKDYPSTYYALGIIKFHIEDYDNLLKNKDKSKFKGKDLADEMNITPQMASVHFKRLKELNLIAEVPTTRGMYWAINPDYYNRSDEIPKLVYDAFSKKIKI